MLPGDALGVRDVSSAPLRLVRRRLLPSSVLAKFVAFRHPRGLVHTGGRGGMTFG